MFAAAANEHQGPYLMILAMMGVLSLVRERGSSCQIKELLTGQTSSSNYFEQ
jgi:hypothetical protein